MYLSKQVECPSAPAAAWLAGKALLLEVRVCISSGHLSFPLPAWKTARCPQRGRIPNQGPENSWEERGGAEHSTRPNSRALKIPPWNVRSPEIPEGLFDGAGERKPKQMGRRDPEGGGFHLPPD